MSNNQEGEWEQDQAEGEWTEVKRKDKSKAKKVPAALPLTKQRRARPVSPLTSATPTTPAPTLPALVITPPVSATNKLFPTTSNAPAAATEPASPAQDEATEPAPASPVHVDIPAIASPACQASRIMSWDESVEEELAIETAEVERSQRMLSADYESERTSDSEPENDFVLPVSVVASMGDDGGAGEDGSEGGSGDDEVEVGDCQDVESGGEEREEGEIDFEVEDEKESDVDVGDENEGLIEGKEESDGEMENETDSAVGGEERSDDEVEHEIESSVEHKEGSATEVEDKPESSVGGKEESVGEMEDGPESEVESTDEPASEEEEPQVLEHTEHAPEEPIEDPQTISDRLTEMLRSSAKRAEPPVIEEEEPEWMKAPEWIDPPMPVTPDIFRKSSMKQPMVVPKSNPIKEERKIMDQEGFQTVESRKKKTVTFFNLPETFSPTVESSLQDFTPSSPLEALLPSKFTREEEKPKVPGASFIEVEKESSPTKKRKRNKPKHRGKKKSSVELPEWARDDEPAATKAPAKVEEAETVKDDGEQHALEATRGPDPAPGNSKEAAAVEHEAVQTHKKRARKRSGRGNNKALARAIDNLAAGKKTLPGVDRIQTGTGRGKRVSLYEWLTDRPAHEIYGICGITVLAMAVFVMMLFDWWLA